MSVTLAQIELQAKQLSAEERALLAEHLLESLQTQPTTDVANAWAKTVEDRVAAYENDEAVLHDVKDVLVEARGRLKHAR